MAGPVATAVAAVRCDARAVPIHRDEDLGVGSRLHATRESLSRRLTRCTAAGFAFDGHRIGVGGGWQAVAAAVTPPW